MLKFSQSCDVSLTQFGHAIFSDCHFRLNIQFSQKVLKNIFNNKTAMGAQLAFYRIFFKKLKEFYTR